MVCDLCQRTWTGNELEAAGTVKHVDACGICRATIVREAKEEAVYAAAQKVLDAPGLALSGSSATEAIPDGTYTVEFADGTYRTLRIKTQDADATWMPGKRVASYLNGPDNWSNYQGFAFVNDNNTFNVWQRHQSATAVISALAVLTSGREAMVNGLKAYGMASGKCGVCGKKLTTPASIKLGIGPICAGQLGI